MTIKAKVFMSGRTQPLPWPAKLCDQAKEMRAKHMGSGIWLQPQVTPEKDMGQWLRQFMQAPRLYTKNFCQIVMMPPRKSAIGLEAMACAERCAPTFAATSCTVNRRASLMGAGKPIGGMNLMTAAHALAEDSVLITKMAREFHRVPILAVEEWAMD